ncbi:hypothetical protein DIPPA_06342 [Diplonema papillatum]|nr:hypothetical protein DIPPA_06342 [Diplonema papillatum]
MSCYINVDVNLGSKALASVVHRVDDCTRSFSQLLLDAVEEHEISVPAEYDAVVYVRESGAGAWKKTGLEYCIDVMIHMKYQCVRFDLKNLVIPPKLAVNALDLLMRRKEARSVKPLPEPAERCRSWVPLFNVLIKDFPLVFYPSEEDRGIEFFTRTSRVLVNLEGAQLQAALLVKYKGYNKAYLHRRVQDQPQFTIAHFREQEDVLVQLLQLSWLRVSDTVAAKHMYA